MRCAQRCAVRAAVRLMQLGVGQRIQPQILSPLHSLRDALQAALLQSTLTPLMHGELMTCPPQSAGTLACDQASGVYSSTLWTSVVNSLPVAGMPARVRVLRMHRGCLGALREYSSTTSTRTYPCSTSRKPPRLAHANMQ